MPATVLTPETRYFRPGTTHVLSLPTVVSAAFLPIRTEINAGKDISAAINAVTGFQKTGSKLDTPDWGSTTTLNIPGRVTFDDSSITFYADVAQVDARANFTFGQTVFIVFMDSGDTPTQKMDIYRCRVLSVSSTKDGDNPAMVVVQFAVTGANEGATIPA